jgi:hypothetical protein
MAATVEATGVAGAAAGAGEGSGEDGCAFAGAVPPTTRLGRVAGVAPRSFSRRALAGAALRVGWEARALCCPGGATLAFACTTTGSAELVTAWTL